MLLTLSKAFEWSTTITCKSLTSTTLALKGLTWCKFPSFSDLPLNTMDKVFQSVQAPWSPRVVSLVRETMTGYQIGGHFWKKTHVRSAPGMSKASIISPTCRQGFDMFAPPLKILKYPLLQLGNSPKRGGFPADLISPNPTIFFYYEAHRDTTTSCENYRHVTVFTNCWPAFTFTRLQKLFIILLISFGRQVGLFGPEYTMYKQGSPHGVGGLSFNISIFYT